MAYSKGGKPAASDYNSLVGSTPVTSAYASSVAATNQVAALLGVGFGDRGYGQTTPALASISSGSVMKAVDWANLRTACANIAAYQGTSTATLPAASQFVAGQATKAEFDWAAYIASLDANRFNTNGGASLTLVSSALTVNRASTWSTTITAEITATFASENAARYFFNTGGALNVNLTHADTTTTQNQNWNTILSALGTISIGARSTTRSGTGGSPATTTGFYELTGTYQRVFTGTNIGSGAYAANDVFVDALVTGVAGVNGGNGTTVKIRVILQDEHTNTFSDIVSAGTKCIFGHKVASSGLLANIAGPSYATVTNW